MLTRRKLLTSVAASAAAATLPSAADPLRQYVRPERYVLAEREIIRVFAIPAPLLRRD